MEGNYEDTVALPGADPFGEALASVQQASQEKVWEMQYYFHCTTIRYFSNAVLSAIEYIWKFCKVYKVKLHIFSLTVSTNKWTVNEHVMIFWMTY